MAAAAFLAASVAGCTPPPPEVAECPAMPVKGWMSLMSQEPFASLPNRKETVFEPLSETSRLLVGDSNYSYGVLLTYTFAHPDMSAGRVDTGARCVNGVSVMSLHPAKGDGEQAIAAFTARIAAHRSGVAIAQRIVAARAFGTVFAPIGRIGEAEVSAGVVESGARGKFFRVEVAAPPLRLAGSAR